LGECARTDDELAEFLQRSPEVAVDSRLSLRRWKRAAWRRWAISRAVMNRADY
jgi:hypothetical protein